MAYPLGPTKVTMQVGEQNQVIEMDAQVMEVQQHLGFAEPMVTEFSLTVIGDYIPEVLNYDHYMTSFRTGEIWSCGYCNSENPKRAKLHSFRPEQEVTHCLRCGGPRHIAYG